MPEKKFSQDCAYCLRRAGVTYRGLRCADCDGPLVVNVDLTLHRKTPPCISKDRGRPGIFEYAPLLPLLDPDAAVSLGEGRTPLLDAKRLGGALGIEALSLKDETRNPTGSFKDRMLALGVSRARELGCRTVAVQSSGNVGAAAAAYAARAGLAAKVFVPRTVPEGKLVQIRMLGADLIRIDHPSPSAVFDLLSWASREFDWHMVSTTALYNPFTLEGSKTIAYELAEQSAFHLPDWVIVPVGGGGNLGSIWRGFRELEALGVVSRLPRLVGVQAEGCAPFVEAVRLGRTPQEAATLKWPEIRTVAGAIADDVVFDAHVALPAIAESAGRAVAVSDEESLEMQRLLGATEGIFVEPSSATALAAARRLAREGVIERGSTVCCLLTGNGLKDLATAAGGAPPPALLPATREAVRAHVA